MKIRTSRDRTYKKKKINYIILVLFFILFSFISFEFLKYKNIKKIPSDLFSVSTNKKSYLRFELVDIMVKLREKNKDITTAKVVAEIYGPSKKLLYTVGNLYKINFVYVPDRKLYVAHWPIPFNPEIGKYKAKIKATYQFKQKKIIGGVKKKYVSFPLLSFIKIPYPEKTPKKIQKPKIISEIVLREFKKDIEFEITKKSPALISPKLCMMDLEMSGDIEKVRIPDFNANLGNWKNIVSWAEFLGADTLSFLVGQTANWGGNQKFIGPWLKGNIDIFPKIAKESKKRGLRVGAWIACFLTFGKNKPYSDYNYAYGYDTRKKSLYETKFISILDERRIRDIIELVKKLDKNPHISFIGLDYIRNAEGGYEMVDEFVKDMNPKLPSNFLAWNNTKRMCYLAEQISLKKDLSVKARNLYEQWNWWRSHKIAEIVNRIIKEGKVKKPVWVYTLGWEHGFQHGQDPIMMNDAGVYFNAVMLYEIQSKEHFNFMISSWKDYIKKSQVNLIVGDAVDWFLHQKTLIPPGPEEFYRRLITGFSFLSGGKCQGVFWHDLSRALFGRKGPYSILEWAIAGMSAFSYVREEWNEIPLRVSILSPEKVKYNKNFEVKVLLINNSNKEIDNIKIRIFPTHGVVINENKIIKILPYEKKEVNFFVNINKISTSRANRYMLACEVKFGKRHFEKIVKFKYLFAN